VPSSSLPTGSVSHRRGDRTRPTDADTDAPPHLASGEQRLVTRDGGSPSARSPHEPRSSRTDTDEAADRIAELEAEVEALERELARREADHQEIIHRYEHVLAESNVGPEHAQSDESSIGDYLAAVVDRSERLVSVSRTTATRRQADERPLRERLVQLLPWR
jgi:DNA anti-recombination protein RmuC